MFWFVLIKHNLRFHLLHWINWIYSLPQSQLSWVCSRMKARGRKRDRGRETKRKKGKQGNTLRPISQWGWKVRLKLAAVLTTALLSGAWPLQHGQTACAYGAEPGPVGERQVWRSYLSRVNSATLWPRGTNDQDKALCVCVYVVCVCMLCVCVGGYENRGCCTISFSTLLCFSISRYSSLFFWSLVTSVSPCFLHLSFSFFIVLSFSFCLLVNLFHQAYSSQNILRDTMFLKKCHFVPM